MNNTASQQNILISACLLGSPVRYDGTNLLLDHPLLKEWQQQGRLIPICPEVAGGMSTPRAPAEIVSIGESTVLDCNQQDVSKAFHLGAEKALQLAKDNNCKVAILTERSPSCGSSFIYDGSFSGTTITGMGITATLLEKNGIRVFNQYQIGALNRYLGR